MAYCSPVLAMLQLPLCVSYLIKDVKSERGREKGAEALIRLRTGSTPAAQAAAQKQLPANEQFMNCVLCNPRVSSDHQENDQAQDVTVSVVMECGGTAYNVQKFLNFATARLLGNRPAFYPGKHQY